ncbi:cytochrome C oxidase Cbb3 [Arcobacter sp. 31_11_sub10_T18]|nr:cytochrome C oxidase Cbb3 [Arcobacter sp. 31_11_sub10_T18]
MNWLDDDVNQLSLLGAVLIILISTVVVRKYIKQMKTDKSTGELIDKSWDGIREYNNELPIGWAVSFLVLIAWAFWYFFIGYPVNSFSQIGQWNEEVSQKNAQFAKKWENPDKETLMGMGEGIFLVQCAPCHGITGDGIDGKATDFSQWGTVAGIENSIINGSKGLQYPLGDMPGGLLQDKAEIKAVSKYIMNGLKNEPKGKEVYEMMCASCHGMDGKGMDGLSPNLATYGTSVFVKDVLSRGKKGHLGDMPKFEDGRLSDIQKEAVGHYILSLGE